MGKGNLYLWKDILCGSLVEVVAGMVQMVPWYFLIHGLLDYESGLFLRHMKVSVWFSHLLILIKLSPHHPRHGLLAHSQSENVGGYWGCLLLFVLMIYNPLIDHQSQAQLFAACNFPPLNVRSFVQKSKLSPNGKLNPNYLPMCNMLWHRQVQWAVEGINAIKLCFVIRKYYLIFLN